MLTRSVARASRLFRSARRLRSVSAERNRGVEFDRQIHTGRHQSHQRADVTPIYRHRVSHYPNIPAPATCSGGISNAVAATRSLYFRLALDEL